MADEKEVIHTRIWREVATPGKPYHAQECYCHGYNVFRDILPKADYFEYLLLLFQGERPPTQHAELLAKLAVAIANPGIRDHSVRAAMNGGAGGSTNAASLMAALAVGAGQLGGAREVFLVVERWRRCGSDLAKWQADITEPREDDRNDEDVWPETEHPPGFDPYIDHAAQPITDTLALLAGLTCAESCRWLLENIMVLEASAQSGLAMSMVAATALHDVGLESDQAEMIYLMLRLPGAAVHALEQKQLGWRKYPFFRDGVKITNDPGPFQAAN